jgi:hypothetical protein
VFLPNQLKFQFLATMKIDANLSEVEGCDFNGRDTVAIAKSGE